MQDARQVGVAHPERIRVLLIPDMPLPDDQELRLVALQTGLLGPNIVGLTLGYGIYIRIGHESRQLLSHECRHVYQYECAGSIAAFLPKYLAEIAEVGYGPGAFELDARNHEIS